MHVTLSNPMNKESYKKSLRTALLHHHWVFPDYVLDKETLIYQGNPDLPSSVTFNLALLHSFNSKKIIVCPWNPNGHIQFRFLARLLTFYMATVIFLTVW